MSVSQISLLERIRKPSRPKVELPKSVPRKPLHRDLPRLLDLFQAIAVGIAANVVLFVVLSFLAVKTSVLRHVPHVVFEVAPSDKESETEASSSASSSRKLQQKSSDKVNPDKTVQEAFRAHALSEFSLPLIGLPSAGEQFSSGAAEFGIGKSLGAQGVETGVSEGDMGSIFAGKGLGDGSEILLYIDISRSMRQHGERVSALVKNLFPRAKIIEIPGCAIVEGSGFVRELESDWSRRSKVFFVCDLQDEITYTGLQKLRQILLHNGPSKELHIISFQNRPILDLKSIVDETWGSVSLVYSQHAG